MTGGVKQELARGAVISFMTNSIGKIVTFVGYIFLARWLGVDGIGTFSFIAATVTFLAILSSVGLPLTLLRFVSAYAVQDRWTDIRLLIRRCIKIAMINSLIVMSTAAIVIIYIIDFDETVEKPMLIGLFMIPLVCLASQRQQTLRALKHLIAFRLAENIVLYVAIMMIGGLIWYSGHASIEVGIFVYIAAALVAFAVGTMLLQQALKPHAGTINDPETARPLTSLLAISLPLMLVYLSQRVIGLVDVAFLGMLSTPEQTGMYSVATRIALAASLALTAANTIAAPLISERFKKGDINDIKLILVWSSLGAAVFGTAVCFGIALFHETILGLFGAGFQQATTFLYLLLFGQLVGCIAGPADFVLSMTGRQKELSIIMIIGAATAVVLCPILISFHGALGAAIATVTAIIVWKAGSLITVWFRVLGSENVSDADSGPVKHYA